MSNTLNELLLVASLDLSKHLAAKSLNLSTIHIFANLNKFSHAVTSNEAYLLHLLAHIVNYNVVTYNKMLAKYEIEAKITKTGGATQKNIKQSQSNRT